MQVPAFHRECNEETADEEEDDGVDVGFGDGSRVDDTGQGQGDDWDEGGGGERYGFADPKDSHERGDGRHESHFGVFGYGIIEKQHGGEDYAARGEAYRFPG